MIRHLKIIMAVGIMSCMFLPLSQCNGSWTSSKKQHETSNRTTSGSVQDSPVNNSPTPDSPVAKRAATRVDGSVSAGNAIVIANKLPSSIADFLVGISFIIPLLFCIPFARNKKLHIALLLTQIAFSVWLLFLVFILVYSFFTPLFGGYLLTLCAVTFFVTGLFELFIYIRWYRISAQQKIESIV